MMHTRRRRYLLVGYLPCVCLACGPDLPGPQGDDEFGETGAEGEDAGDPGPGGPGCDEHWYPLDGLPLEDSDVLPELSPQLGSIAPSHQIDLSGPPPPAPAYEPVATPETAPSSMPLEWEEFVIAAAEPTAGGWYVEDDLFRTYEQLYDDFLRYRARFQVDEFPQPSLDLLSISRDGLDAVWSGPQKIALTWCVGWLRPRPDTPENAELHAERYERMIRSMEEAGRAWERVTNVNFIHLREFDDPEARSPRGGACQPGEDGVLFRVRMDVANGCDGPCKGAVNFNPHTELESVWAGPDNPEGLERDLILSSTGMANDDEALTTALHELGHAIGFEHEHYRPQFPECESDLFNWRPLTPADPDSVMGYDTCNGVNPNQPRLSAYDRLGAFFLNNWSRRHSTIMSAASQIDDLSYDGSGRAGVAWYRAADATLDMWTSITSPGEDIVFDKHVRCLDGQADPPCTEDETWRYRARPSPLFATGSAADLDILLYGPGDELESRLLENLSLGLEGQAIDVSGHLVPVIGSFEQTINDQILFYGPGAAVDIIWDPKTQTSVIVDYPDYAYPLPGRYRGFGGGGSDILWYQPHAGTFEIWQWLDFGEPFDFLRQGASDASPLGLIAGRDYVPLLGDFNGDARTDIFWYAPGDETDWLWISVSNQEVVIFDAYPHQVEGQYQSYVGDFNADGTHDILWYSVGDDWEGGHSGIWYFDAEGGHDVSTFSVRGDYTPVIADFDADGCSDILWYDPLLEDPEAVVWRCVPSERDFTCEEPQGVPRHGFPIGYGGAF